MIRVGRHLQAHSLVESRNSIRYPLKLTGLRDQLSAGGSSTGWRGKKGAPWTNPLEVGGSMAAIASANLVGNPQPWPEN